jgi:anaerobic magnesium-protoporphyrin IX monomethyl ester cyclase
MRSPILHRGEGLLSGVCEFRNKQITTIRQFSDTSVGQTNQTGRHRKGNNDQPMPKSTSSSRKVVFFFPSFASSEATAPLGILAVATPLIRAGYQIVLIDSTITADYKKRVLEEVRDAVCLGISLVTGPMIRETVEIARAVKEWNSEFPIILGGWHPSLLPEQTLQTACVDYIVRGQGEDALLELVEHLDNKSAPDLIAGIGFKRGANLS